MNDTVLKALNDQIHMELESAYIYLAMAAHFEAEAFPGFAAWMRKQREEEITHAMRLFDHVVDRGGRVELQSLSKPQGEFGSPLEVFEAALAHEQKVTRSIHELYALAVKENDAPAQVEMHWFITEQVEEEKTAGDIVDKLRRAGDSDAALLLIDERLGARGAAEG